MPRKGDPERAARWRAREAEWYRLAGSAAESYIAGVCRGFAKQAGVLATFWEKEW